MSTNMNSSYSSKPIMSIMNELNNYPKQGSINLQPTYQRAFVWNSKLQVKLIYSLIKNYPIGNVVFRVNNGILEVVDGQQRLTTIYKFINNELALKNNDAISIIHLIINTMEKELKDDPKFNSIKRKLNNKKTIKLTFSNLPEKLQMKIWSYNINITFLDNASNEDVLEYFNFIQNQEKLRAGELINSISNTPLIKYLYKIDNLPLFLKKINFKNNKHLEFNKHFYSILGLLTNKINLGVSDKQILKFTLNPPDTLENINLVNHMLEGINTLTKDKNIKIKSIEHANTRSTKFLLLLLAFNYMDLKHNTTLQLNNLSNINKLLATFNSSKPYAITNTFKNYNNQVVIDFEKITELSKGSHSFLDVKETIKKLGYYINNFSYNNTLPYK